MKSVLFACFAVIFTLCFNAQVGPRTWQDHLSINSCNSVTKLGTKIYASYGNGLIKFDQSEISPQVINKSNGLSDVGIRLLRTNPYNNKLLVIYDNTNIDIIDINGSIKNYPDFKLKSLGGKKVVNEVTFFKQFAYLACGFGVVVFDTERLEIKDTYYIGPNASPLDVYQVALTDSLIFAATSIGMLKANYLKGILNNYKNWIFDSINLPKGPYVGVVNASGKVYCAYAPSKLDPSIQGKDTLYKLKINSWENKSKSASTILKMGTFGNNTFYMFNQIGLLVSNVITDSLVTNINNFNGQSDYGTLRDVYFDKDHTSNISYWLADVRFGLYRNYYYYEPSTKVVRNGTNSHAIGNIDALNGIVALSPAYVDNAGIPTFSREGINILKEGEWSYISSNDLSNTPIIDITSIMMDRKDKTKMWATSWFYGVMQYKNNKLVSVYTPSNIGMPVYSDKLPRCSGLSMDKDGNVWFAQSDLDSYLGVIKKSGEFQGFKFNGGKFARKTFVDKNNFVWILHEREGGITVFKNNGFNSPQVDINYKILGKEVGKGNLQSNSVYSIAEDKDGKIWIGTDAGISVFYNSANMFTRSDFDSQPIKIVQDGNVELLLSKETVKAITIDGANNKWVGTESGGIYCFSPDGITQLYHFTKENSPLYSNTIVDINYNEATGDIFIGTSVGLQSFRSIILEGGEQYTNVYAFPNPVRPDYQGTVLIRGLVDNSIVKIVDESGNMVWEIKSTGGQVEWPITNLSGSRVSSGVYVVYASNTTAELKALTKILVVN